MRSDSASSDAFAATRPSSATTTSDRRNALTLELRRAAGALTVTVHETMAEAEARLTELEALNDGDLDAVLVNIARISQL